MESPLSARLVDFVESGVSLLVGGCDAQRRPCCVRGGGARVEPGGREVTVFVPQALGGALIDGFEHNPRIAVTLSRPMDHRTLQLKGEVREVRASDERDLALQDRYLVGFTEQLSCVGMTRSVVRRLRIKPSWAVRFVVDQVFDQTPGPQAGMPLGREGER